MLPDMVLMGVVEALRRTLRVRGPGVHDLVIPVMWRLTDGSARVSFTLVGCGVDARLNGFRIGLLRRANGLDYLGERQVVCETRFDNEGRGWNVRAAAELRFVFDVPLDLGVQAGGLDATVCPGDVWWFRLGVDMARVALSSEVESRVDVINPGGVWVPLGG